MQKQHGWHSALEVEEREAIVLLQTLHFNAGGGQRQFFQVTGERECD